MSGCGCDSQRGEGGEHFLLDGQRGDFPNRVGTEGVSCNLITNTDEHTFKTPTYIYHTEYTQSTYTHTHTHLQLSPG